MSNRNALKAQVTVETALLMLAAIGAFVFMVIYFQRGYQGYLYSASSQGVQFDPRNLYSTQRTLTLNQTQNITIQAGPTTDVTTGIDDLPDTPGGQTSRVSVQTADVTSTWNVQGNGNYTAGN